MLHEHASAPGGPRGGATPHGRAFAIGTALNLGYVILEATFGLISGSLALLADAGHNLSDVLGLLLAWGAANLARRAPTRRRTYGWRRGSVLASLGNAGLLLVATGAIAWEATRRLFAGTQAVETGTILWVAAIGVVVNLGTALLFLRGRRHDLNIRGAFLHMAADAAVTVGVIIAAIGIGFTGWHWLDPATSLAIAAVILAGSWGLLRESLDLALDAVPAGIDPAEVERWLAEQPGVVEVHDLHIWALGTQETALTTHLLRPAATGPDDAFLARLRHGLQERFGIAHATVQVESGDPVHPCPQAPADML
jgi:cobalt-zinc-cadmium efflux system protein